MHLNLYQAHPLYLPYFQASRKRVHLLPYQQVQLQFLVSVLQTFYSVMTFQIITTHFLIEALINADLKPQIGHLLLINGQPSICGQPSPFCDSLDLRLLLLLQSPAHSLAFVYHQYFMMYLISLRRFFDSLTFEFSQRIFLASLDLPRCFTSRQPQLAHFLYPPNHQTQTKNHHRQSWIQHL